MSLARFERALHFEGFRHQPGVLDGDGGLARYHLDEADFVFGELARFAGVMLMVPITFSRVVKGTESSDARPVRRAKFG